MHLKIIKIVFMNTLINQIIVSLGGNFHLLFKSGLSEKIMPFITVINYYERDLQKSLTVYVRIPSSLQPHRGSGL